MPELLLELLSEEIPARMQDRAAADLAALLAARLDELGLSHDGSVRTFATPRRLVAVVPGLAARQADRTVERRGPRADAPEAARAGFLRSLAGVSFRIEERDEKKARVVFALVEEPGRPTPELLSRALPELLARFSWPKSMRWGEGEARWVRPLQRILCLFDGAVVPFAFAGIESGALTRGHRFMAPEPFEVLGAADHAAGLRRAKVVLDGAERRASIREGARALAAERGFRLREDEGLLDELKGLVEWPVPLAGRIDAAFMDLPPEVLVTTMREHQRYLALEDGDGRLAPAFVAVANVAADDGGAAIVAGNERVLRARLWDARFFWEQDRRRPLAELLPKLDSVVFHAELGTQGERVRRLERLAPRTLELLSGNFQREIGLARRAAHLAKADLASGLVGEFPELQGIVGGRIAEAQGEPREVVQAIADQYLFRATGRGGEPAPVAGALALADKLDVLVGFFGRGIRPSGSKDPFALRRAALGVIAIAVENDLDFDVGELIEAAHPLYGERLAGVDPLKLRDDLLRFLTDRLAVYLRDRGVRHDLVAAVAATGDRNIRRMVARAEALRDFFAGDDGLPLLAGWRRAGNIVSIEEKKDGRRYGDPPSDDLHVSPQERDLAEALRRTEGFLADDIGAGRFGLAMGRVARLRAPVDAFFDAVMVNAPEPELRENRLRLLNRIRSALAPIADFSLVEEAGSPTPGPA